VYPQRYDPLVDNIDTQRLQRGMLHRRNSIRRLAEGLPSHTDFLARHCSAEAA
jgi:tryptophan halogenase